MPQNVPIPTPIYRLMHIDNLDVYLRRGGLHAANCTPRDGLVYRAIHNVAIQQRRSGRRIPCGPGGVIHDYVPFYFGYLSPMLLQLHTRQVQGYDEGQEPLIYLVATAQEVAQNGLRYVFSDGHGLASYTKRSENLHSLDQVDWDMVYRRYWADDVDSDMDRQRRKQAEFLVYRFCPWDLIREVVVIDRNRQLQVQRIFGNHTAQQVRPIRIEHGWYY